MNKMTKVMGLVALAGALNVASMSAFAGNHNECKSVMHKQGSHSQCEHRDNRDQHCSKKGSWYKASPEKKQAMMQLKIENRLEQMTRKMDLSPEQQIQVRKIMQESHLKTREIREQMRAQIDQVLTPEQRQHKERRGEKNGTPHQKVS
ncbi:MAG: hypothetical protein JXK16_07200 [Thiotrichales bacterium]|nr:hypothetical protein [Thiotrichales bacterium]